MAAAARGRSQHPLWAGRGLSVTGWGHYFPQRREVQPPEQLPAPTRAETAVVGETLGVLSRHVAGPGESVPEMAVRAAQVALAHAGRAATDVDLLVMSSWTDPVAVPEHAPRVARELGADRALAFNVGGACIGFVHGVHTAASLLVAQGLRCAVVVTSDRFTTRLADAGWGNRLAGDGAGAAVVEVDAGNGSVLHDSVVLSFGEHARLATVSARTGMARSLPTIAEVATATAGQAIELLLHRNDRKLPDLDWVVAHPGSQKVLDTLRGRLDVPPERILTNFGHRGSTAGATVPTTISEYLDSGLLHHGDLIITPSMGAGWYAGALLLTL
jgi:3-oxoacyl-[acyl-carrier-protein] synthase-3